MNRRKCIDVVGYPMYRTTYIVVNSLLLVERSALGKESQVDGRAQSTVTNLKRHKIKAAINLLKTLTSK